MRSFFVTIKETLGAIKKPDPAMAGARVARKEQPPVSRTEALGRIALTLVLIVVVVYMFKWAGPENSFSELGSTIMGSILGYWFR